MPLFYSVVARGTTVLAKYASCAGNFAEVSEQILGRIPPENAKLTYTQSRSVLILMLLNCLLLISMCIHTTLAKLVFFPVELMQNKRF